MLKISDLKEFNKLAKRKFKFCAVGFRYHNKNNSGGNFGIDYKGNSKHYELSGNYNREGNLTELRIGEGYALGYKVNLETIQTNEDLLSLFERIINEIERFKENDN